MKKHNNITQGSEEWQHIRKGKITGTMLKGLMGTPKARQEAIYDIIGQKLKVGVDEEYENPMARGIRLEPEARAAYEEATGAVVEVCGFTNRDDNDDIAESPDGFVGDVGAIEIKCPEHKNFIKYWLEDCIPDEYLWQIVQKFVVNTQLEWLDFVVYNPDILSHPLHIKRIVRGDLVDQIATAHDKERMFLEEVNSIINDRNLIEF